MLMRRKLQGEGHEEKATRRRPLGKASRRRLRRDNYTEKTTRRKLQGEGHEKKNTRRRP
jgi:hypothetical protein